MLKLVSGILSNNVFVEFNVFIKRYPQNQPEVGFNEIEKSLIYIEVRLVKHLV